jgi:predicted nucleic acid-binding protein
VLLDTSGLLCYLDRSDARHGDAIALFRSAPVRLTHSYVLSELIPLCEARRVPRSRALVFMHDLLDSPHVEVVWVEQSAHRAAMALLEERPDKTYSICDAVSFLLMRQRGITGALTTDRHFEREGFVRLLKP